MLLIEAKFQGLETVGVERKQIKVIVGAAVKDAALVIDGGIEEGVSLAAIFRLDVEGQGAEFHIGIVAEEHAERSRFPKPGIQERGPRMKFTGTFDRAAPVSLL